MSPLEVLALKGLAGGVGVVVFALVSEVVTPKTFAGLFAAAPSVALASLVVTVLDKGTTQASPSSLGMVAGAAGMIAFCVVAVRAIPRLHAVVGSVLALAAWAAVAAVLGLAFLR